MRSIRGKSKSINKKKRNLQLLDIALLLVAFVNMVIAYLENVQKFSNDQYYHSLEVFPTYETEFGTVLGVTNERFCDIFRFINIGVCLALCLGIIIRY